MIANGHEAHWDYIHHDGAAAVVAVADDGQLLMVRQYLQMPWTGRRWRFRLASWMRRMNRRLRCAYRELEEETGYRCEKLEYLMSLNTTVAFCDEAIDVFEPNLIPSHQHLDEDEVINVGALERGGPPEAYLCRQDDRCQDRSGDYGLRGKIRKVRSS